MTDMKSIVTVEITVNVNGQTETFTAQTSTDSNPYTVADGVLSGVKSDASNWLNRSSIDRRREYTR